MAFTSLLWICGFPSWHWHAASVYGLYNIWNVNKWNLQTPLHLRQNCCYIALYTNITIMNRLRVMLIMWYSKLVDKIVMISIMSVSVNEQEVHLGLWMLDAPHLSSLSRLEQILEHLILLRSSLSLVGLSMLMMNEFIQFDIQHIMSIIESSGYMTLPPWSLKL